MKKIGVLIIDENKEEQFIKCEYSYDGDTPYINLSDILIDIDMKSRLNYIQECFNRFPAESQTEEMCKMLEIIFGLNNAI